MDFAGFINDLKDKFDSLKIKIVDFVKKFYEENRMLSIIISGLFLVILLCIILLFTMTPKDKKENNSLITQKLDLSEELQIPGGPELPESYTISRKTKSVWTEEEAEAWFTIPTQKEINALAQTNENMIKELLGATP